MVEPARVSIPLKEVASSGRKPPLMARRKKPSRQLRSLSLENSPGLGTMHQPTNRCRRSNMMQGLLKHHHDLRVCRAYGEEEQEELRAVNNWPETDRICRSLV